MNKKTKKQKIVQITAGLAAVVCLLPMAQPAVSAAVKSANTKVKTGTLTMDTRSYTMSPNNIYDFRATVSGDGLAQSDVTVSDSRTGSIVNLTRLPNGNFRIKGLHSGTAYVIAEINGVHASIKVTVQKGVKQHGVGCRATTIVPIPSQDPTDPADPTNPTDPTQPTQPTEPVYPGDSITCDVKSPKLIGGWLNLTGQTNGETVTVEKNGVQADTIQPISGNFSYNCDISGYEPGWYYFNFITAKAQTGVWVHKVENNQPSVVMPRSTVDDARVSNKLYSRSYRTRLVNNYTPSCDYFNSSAEIYIRTDTVDFDENGIPVVKYDDTWQYNPVTVAQFALKKYGQALKTDKDYTDFLKTADWLVNYQNTDGSLVYDFSFQYNKDITIPKGFVSAMAQGQALSVYARAYLVSYDEKYLKAGKTCLDFMLKQSGDGGCTTTLQDFAQLSSSLSQYKDLPIYELYLCKPQTYVLNGDMFALMGLYDWSQTAFGQYGSIQADQAFRAGCKSVEVILPYFDYNGFTSYDLLPYINGSDPYFSNSYAHMTHTYLLNTLAQLTGSDIFRKYYQRFADYYNDGFYRQTEQEYR